MEKILIVALFAQVWVARGARQLRTKKASRISGIQKEISQITFIQFEGAAQTAFSNAFGN